MNPEKTPKVLIAEDGALIAMREVLSLIGLEVVGVAASVNDALCLAQNTQPDLAIFDVRLAGKRDGIEAAALLRDIIDIPVVFLTANGDQEPVSSQQIVAAVESALTE